MPDGRAGLPLLQTLALTAAAMLAFAANSLLCRLALRQEFIDPASFASIRLVAGAVTLAVIVRLRSDPNPSASRQTDWLAAAMLFAYVAFFSFAYLSLSAGTGALILFGAVQVTMFSVGLRAGEMFSPIAWIGLALAVAGLVYLVSPGLAAPAPLGAAMMGIAGLAWGVYSLRGRGVANPLAATAGNFVRAAPLALVLSLLLATRAHADAAGVALALASGAVTSGIGYVIWYAALRGLSATRAATVQLSVPPIAAFGGVVFLSEAITPRLLVASAAILGGIALVLATKSQSARPRRPS
ncbi:DMT family transporter [Aquabacterium sp.]|uniref:DMT family transporter n=1 Tax=Aquabacterium sp. TaxID=1872578 RepID=UPI002C596181|nr:DMT family transporter [Aquabacterium sp.]HSW05063.1 DMT family transporter [Aquabacterium sp.]